MIVSMSSRKFFLAATLAASIATLPAATDPPIACNMKALTSEQRKYLGQRAERVISAIASVRELNDGYAFHVDPLKASLMDVAQWLDLWRRCCPFYEFRIDYHAADGDVWLSVTGRPGVKEYLPLDSPLLAAKLPERNRR
jgi:hypothetical protein